ncbi:DUF2177 family protein [Gemmobacter serpentinus]|uniref:DUF2177 family protein n=1 Tax=Gemmobacter serpentinus TaxID=2652247 RepID=UPI00124DFD4B|nr:DUF2177 family protein [Gemmobacter serpentinus]
MGQVVFLYAVTSSVFLVFDSLGIRYLIRPIFETHIGHLLAAPLRLGAAVAFYLLYVAGVMVFVSWPALKSGAPLQALLLGALLGAMCYGTYEMTNYATLADWSWQQVVVDGLWGTFLTGFAAWAGVAAVSGRLV